MSFAPVGPTSEWGSRASLRIVARNGRPAQDRRLAAEVVVAGDRVNGTRRTWSSPSPSRAAPTWLSTTRANSAGMRSRALRSPDWQRRRCGSRMTIECTGTINLQDADFDL